MDRQHIQAIVEIFPQPAGGDGCLQGDVGGRDDTHIRLDRLASADPQDLSLLQETEQQHLQIGRHVSDLVEKQGAVLGVFDMPALCRSRTGEGPFFVTEQLRRDQ